MVKPRKLTENFYKSSGLRLESSDLSKASRDVCYSIQYTTLSSLTHCIPLLAVGHVSQASFKQQA